MASPPGIFCNSCDYDLKALPTGRCPECGRDFDPLQPATFATSPSRGATWWPHRALIWCSVLPAMCYGTAIMAMWLQEQSPRTAIGEALQLLAMLTSCMVAIVGTGAAVIGLLAVLALAIQWAISLVQSKPDWHPLVHAALCSAFFASSMAFAALLASLLLND